MAKVAKQKCAAECGKELPATSAYFKGNGSGKLAAMCRDCDAARRRLQMKRLRVKSPDQDDFAKRHNLPYLYGTTWIVPWKEREVVFTVSAVVSHGQWGFRVQGTIHGVTRQFSLKFMREHARPAEEDASCPTA